MAHVVRNVGKVMRATTSSGDVVERQERLALRDGSYPCVMSDTHFIYRTRRLGTTTKCTCGSDAVIVGYQQYKNYEPFIGNEVLMCMAYAQNGRHADGSY